MWIRSQDKETLAKVDYLDLSEDADGKIEIVVFSKNGLIDTMGLYKTKERALEVLDEIQDYIKKGKEQRYNDRGLIIETSGAWVYNMPKE